MAAATLWSKVAMAVVVATVGKLTGTAALVLCCCEATPLPRAAPGPATAGALTSVAAADIAGARGTAIAEVPGPLVSVVLAPPLSEDVTPSLSVVVTLSLSASGITAVVRVTCATS